MDKTAYYRMLELKYPRGKTASNYGYLAKRLGRFWHDDAFDQGSVDAFLRTIHKNASYSNPLYKAFLKSYLAFYDDDLAALGVRIKVHIPKKVAQIGEKRRFLTDEEIRFLIHSIGDKQVRLMMRVLYETGLRISEFISIKIEDIDLDTRTMTGIGKGGYPFKVRFSETTRDWIRKWLGMCVNPSRPFVFYRLRDPETVCVGQVAAADTRLLKACDALQFGERVTPHRARHALGHHLRADLDLDMQQIREKLRHHSLNSTAIYTTATSEEVDAIIEERMFKRRRLKHVPVEVGDGALPVVQPGEPD